MRTWRITRRGARYSRWELLVNGRPSGQAYKGPRFERVEGRFVPVPNIILVTYTTGMDVRLTEKAAQNLKHLGLVSPGIPIIGEDRSGKVLDVDPGEGNTETDEVDETDEVEGNTEGPNGVVVPEDWKSLPKDARVKLASQIAGKRIKTATMANRIIEEHLG